MDLLRSIKVAIKFSTRFHPRYFSLIKKNTHRTQGEKVYADDIFVITSCINTGDGNYINHNTAHKPDQRFSETITGLQSIREFYPRAYIVFIESSQLSEQQKSTIAPLINKYMDYSNAPIIKTARKHYNKGVPQFTAYIKFFEENQDIYSAGTFHFLGARYILTGDVAKQYEEPGSYFLFFPQHDNVSTRYFFIKKTALRDVIHAFRRTVYFAALGNSVEDILHGYMPQVKNINELKVRGVVNGQQHISE